MRKLLNGHALLMLMFSIIFVICSMTVFAQEDYVLYVGDTQVTSENASDIFGDGKVSYDAETNTLYLNGAGISTSHEVSNNSQGQVETAAIYAEQELNIVVSGLCSVMSDPDINSYNDYAIKCVVPNQGEGALTIRGEGEDAILNVSSNRTSNATYAIYTLRADVVIEDIELTCYSASAIESQVILANDAAVYIDNSTVECNSGIAQVQTSGICSGRGIKVSGASSVSIVAKKCEYYDTSLVQSFGILTLGTLEVCEESKLTSWAGEIRTQGAANAHGVCANSIIVSGNSEIEAYSSYINSSDPSSNCISIGVYATDILVKDTSAIRGTGANASTSSAGVLANTIVTEDKGKVYGTSPYSVTVHSPIASYNPIESTGSAVYDGENKEYLTFVAPQNGFPGYYVNSSGVIPHQMVVASEMEFDLWIGGVRVTSKNCTDVFGDGSVVYDHVTRVLTLNNANITGSYVYRVNSYSTSDGNGNTVEVTQTDSAALYSDFPITIQVIGDVVIDCSDDTATHNRGISLDRYYSQSDETNEIIGIGDASLTVKSGGVEESYGIFVEDGYLVMKDLDINIMAGDTTETSVGALIHDADYSLEISNCNAVFAGGNINGNTEMGGCGGLGGGSIYIKDGSNVTASAGDVTGAGGCAGVITIGYFDISGNSTFNAYGGDITADSGTAQSFGMFVLGMVTVGDDCALNAYGGDVHHSGDATMETAQSAGFGLTIASLTIGDNAVMNAFGGYCDGASAGVYITDAQTTPEYDETVVFTSKTGILNAGTTNTNENAINVGLYLDNPVENGTVRHPVTGEILQYSGGVYLDSEGNLVANSLVTGGVIYFGDYNLAVGDVIVTRENKDDIFGELDEGVTAYYDDVTNTLTLDNANITTLFNMDGTYVGILCMNELNINLVGYNKVDATNYPELPYTGLGVAVAGDLEIYSEKDAILDVYAGDSYGENYGVYIIPLIENVSCDLTVSGEATLISHAGNVDFEYSNTTSAGVYAYGKINVLDGASISAYGGICLPSETNTNSYFNAMSVGIVAMDMATINTTGKVYGYGEKAVTVFGGMGFVGGLEVKKGVVVGEAGKDVPEGSMSIGLCTANEVENVIVKTGASEEELYDGTWYFVDDNFGGAYLYNGANLGTYTTIVSEQFFGSLDVKEAVNGAYLSTRVSAVINGNESAVVVAFASYDANGKMIDVCFEDSQTADETGRIVCEDLCLDDAELVKVFVFDNTSSFMPLNEEIENTLFTLKTE